MKEIYTEIEIDAPASVVWDILTDFESYPLWNPFIPKISGNPSVGARIEVFIKPTNSNGMRFKPKILSFSQEEKIKWLGTLGIPKLFDGEHSLIIKKLSENKVLFIQKEKFTGLFIPLLPNVLKNTESGFRLMNHALKEKAEKKVG